MRTIRRTIRRGMYNNFGGVADLRKVVGLTLQQAAGHMVRLDSGNARGRLGFPIQTDLLEVAPGSTPASGPTGRNMTSTPGTLVYICSILCNKKLQACL